MRTKGRLRPQKMKPGLGRPPGPTPVLTLRFFPVTYAGFGVWNFQAGGVGAFPGYDNKNDGWHDGWQGWVEKTRGGSGTQRPDLGARWGLNPFHSWTSTIS